MKKVSIVILDDSLLMREALAMQLEKDSNFTVAAKASNAYEARDAIVLHKPDLMLCDVHMDKINGLDFLKIVLPQYYLPIVMISGDHTARGAAVKAGAVDFIEKPRNMSPKGTDLFMRMVLASVRNVVAGMGAYTGDIGRVSSRLIAIGASTGGAVALEQILTALPPVLPPVVVAQHMPARFTASFAERLNRVCRVSVKEAEDGESLYAGQVYIAPGGYHMRVEKKDNRFLTRLTKNEVQGGVCPSVDELFFSVAAAAKDQAVGALLTGMGRDGAKGLLAMREAGAHTIGQDEASSVVYGMPKAAFDLGACDIVLPLDLIASRIIKASE